jgi:hypothetical protein
MEKIVGKKLTWTGACAHNSKISYFPEVASLRGTSFIFTTVSSFRRNRTGQRAGIWLLHTQI